MFKELVVAARVAAVTLAITGLVYPLVVTGLAQVLFPGKANGSLVSDDKGNVVGAEAIGQVFTNPSYAWPRPSAAGSGYDASASSGSNLGVTSQKLLDRVKGDVERLKRENPDAQGPIPADLVTASGSGLDPDVTPEGARWQATRIARARNVQVERVLAVIDGVVEGRSLGVLGEPRVNVLRLNLALDRQFGKPVAAPPNPTPAEAPAQPAAPPTGTPTEPASP